jgi:hypothetical protein
MRGKETTQVLTGLVCPDCQYENEVERIYCHSCGARLERSGLIKDKATIDESDAQARAHLEKMLRPPGLWKRRLTQFLKLLLGAICLAALVEIILPPDLPPQAKEAGFAPMINMDLASAIESHQPPQLVYSEEQVNSYLASSIRRGSSPAKEGFCPLTRMLVSFGEGSCAMTVERQLFGLSIYGRSAYRIAVEGGKISSANSAGYIGRLPIHPALMRGTEALLFSKAWETLARERKQITRLAGIEFHPQSVTLTVAR